MVGNGWVHYAKLQGSPREARRDASGSIDTLRDTLTTMYREYCEHKDTFRRADLIVDADQKIFSI